MFKFLVKDEDIVDKLAQLALIEDGLAQCRRNKAKTKKDPYYDTTYKTITIYEMGLVLSNITKPS